jgi:hypothetical protein
MLENVKKLMESHPAVFNPIWSMVYPIVRRSDGHVHSSHSDNRVAFETIYQNNYWGNEESRSGWGSTLAYTAPLRGALEKLTRKLGTRVMLDAPCGDFNWMQHVHLPENCRYIGGDIVAPLVTELQNQYAGPARQFEVIDIVKDELPQADLWLCRDVLFHLPLADVTETLERFARSKVSYLLTTTYDFEKINADVKPGGFRYLNMRRAPFSLPPPELRIADFVAPAPPRYLGLWSRAQVAAAMHVNS